jgi:hypothetical protein
LLHLCACVRVVRSTGAHAQCVRLRVCACGGCASEALAPPAPAHTAARPPVAALPTSRHARVRPVNAVPLRQKVFIAVKRVEPLHRCGHVWPRQLHAGQRLRPRQHQQQACVRMVACARGVHGLPVSTPCRCCCCGGGGGGGGGSRTGVCVCVHVRQRGSKRAPPPQPQPLTDVGCLQLLLQGGREVVHYVAADGRRAHATRGCRQRHHDQQQVRSPSSRCHVLCCIVTIYP